jgi:hypothetical protein
VSFLAPLFLIGGLALAGPVIFHLVRQTTRERKIFSSLMFLQPSPPRMTRRSRLEHLLLLLLRCSALVLLALGFARPFLKRAVANPDARAGRRVVLLLDTSASMKRQGLWPETQKRVEQFLRDTSPLDQVSLMTFDRVTRTLLSFDQWNKAPIGDRVVLALGRLKETAPGWGGTHLGRALVTAAETLVDESGKPNAGPRQIILFTDLQEGSRLDSLQGYEWPKETRLSVETIVPAKKSNAGLQLVTEADVSDSKDAALTRVRVSNSAGSTREQFKVGWAGSAGSAFVSTPTEIYVPAGQSRIVPLPLPTNGSPTRVLLQGDDEDFDNSVFLAPPETKRLTVLYLGNESEADPNQPFYFLRNAFQETRREAVKVLARSSTSPPSAMEIQSAALIIVTESLSVETAREMRQQVMKGRTVLFLVRNDDVSTALCAVLGIDKLEIAETRPKDYAMLGEIDFSNPLFAPFSDPRFNDFTKIHFWKYWKLDAARIPGARVLARFDSHDPALIEVPVGEGRVMTLSSGWQPEESQLALSTKFVPLLYAMLDLSSPTPDLPAQYFVGDTLPLDVIGRDGNRMVRLPDGSEQRLARGETNFSGTTRPGIYEVVPEQPANTSRFAVNLEASESRTEPMPADQLESLGAPMQVTTSADKGANTKVRLHNNELEGRQKLWRWFLLATLIVVLVETWLAGRTARIVPIVPAQAKA